MPRVVTPDSDEGKELIKWEQHPQHWNGTTYQPGNPYVFRPYPRMVYRATTKENGKVVCMEAPPQPDAYEKPHEFDRAQRLHDQLQKACYQIVADEGAHLVAKGQGWCDSIPDALAAYEARQVAIGDATAARNFTDQRMSGRAREEARQADEATHEHVPDVPAPKLKPKRRKPGPKPRAHTVTSPVMAEAARGE